MSGQSGSEKTEKASKKKRDKAREEGQVVKSNDVNIAFSVIALFSLLYICWDGFIKNASFLVSKYLSPGFLAEASVTLNKASVMNVYQTGLTDTLKIVWPVFVVAMLCGVLVNVMQTGLMLTPKALMPKLSKINPIEGFKRIFSVRAGVEMLKASAKVVCLCYFIYSEYSSFLSGFPSMMRMEAGGAFLEIMKKSLMIGIKMGAVLGVISAMDYFYQSKKYEKDLMMTKQEVKDEYKQLEGDPKVKGRIRQKQRQMSRMRMMRRMKEADVVITNPTHYAVAVRYKQDEDRAPLVLAKGKDVLAQKIKEKAKEHGIQIIENKPVAQALYFHCDIETEIPKDMYQAVAEILVYVYRMRNKTSKGEN